MLNSLPGLSGTTVAGRAGASASAGKDAPDDIQVTVQRTLSASVEYQILRKTFARENDQTDDRPAAESQRGAATPAPPPADGSFRQPATGEAEMAAAMRVASQRASQGLAIETRELRVEAGNEAVQQSDPLLLDLDGDGIETTGVDAGVRFDIDADGDLDQSSFASGGDAFLALDRNGNGRIDDGSELFGDQLGHANGFAALADYDANGDGIIDARDPVYPRLQLLSYHAGRFELQSLEAAGILAIGTDYASGMKQLNGHDRALQFGWYRDATGRLGSAVDVVLGHREA